MAQVQNSSARINILGSYYSRMRREVVNEWVLSRAKAGGGGYVCVSNVHTTMMGRESAEYQKITNESDLSIPDGMPLVWAMKCLGAPEQDRVRGPTLMREICDQGRARQLKHYLLGGSPDTLALLEKKLNAEYPGILIVGKESPPYRTPTQMEKEMRIKMIRNSGAEIIWVGLGAPKQERWMYEHRKEFSALMLGVGAAFDLLAGKISEAPAWMQACGLEWAYRFAKEPKRLWRRYLWNNPAFLILLLLHLLRIWVTGRNRIEVEK